MHHSFRNLAVISLCIVSPVLSDHLGPKYIPPVDLSSDKSIVAAAWKNATSTIERYLSDQNSTSTSGIPGIQNATFSVGMFSLVDPKASKLQFHYSSPMLAATNGTKQVDADSLYPVASITKVFTVLTGLLNLNSTDWERSVADLFPQLGEFAKQHPGEDDPINTIQWDKVTVSNLAAQIAGLPTNPLVADIAISGKDMSASGYPPVNMSRPNIQEAFDALEDQVATTWTVNNTIPQLKAGSPNFLPWDQPLYSNNGFILLTAAIQKITGKKLPTLSQNTILNPLHMSSSFYGIVPDSERNRSVILSDASWNLNPGLASGSGSIVSTINDLAKFGTAVLNSTLLREEETRRWMKPVSHTARSQYAMGRPWEIIRYTHSSGAITDMYTKAGQAGTAISWLVIIPEYNAGFTILAASSDLRGPDAIGMVTDIFANTILPALNDQAAKEAEDNFAGTYQSTVPGLNSSVVLCVNHTQGAAPGLFIKSFISNGTAFGDSFPLYYAAGARLTPSILSDKNGKVGFRVATAGDAPGIDKNRRLFLGEGSADHLIGDAVSYGGVSLSQWAAEVDKNGKATTISPAWLDATLKRMA